MEVATKRLLYQQEKNTKVVLVPFCIWKCVPTAISGGVDISKVPRCHFCASMMVTEITSRIDVSNSQPPFISNSMNRGYINKKI